MGSIGDVYFGTNLETGGLNAQAKKAGDQAGTTMGKSIAASIKKSWSGGEIGRGLVQGLGLAGGLGAARLLTTAISGVVDILGDAVTAGVEEEKSIAKLTTAIKANVVGWDGNTDAIERVLKSRMKLGFSDDEQRQSLALIVGAVHDVNKALAIQRVAMDLARFKNIDLAAASEALVKVEGGQYRLLKSLGIQLPKNATAQDALNAVQKVATGQAAEQAKTIGGRLLNSQIAMGEALEELGKAIMPLVANATEALSGAVTELAKNIGPVIEQIEKWIGPLLKAIEIQNLLNDAIRDGLSPQDELLKRKAEAAKALVDQNIAAVAAAGGIEKWAAANGVAVSSLAKIGPAATTASTVIRASATSILQSIQAIRSGAQGDAQAAADALYDPIIKAAELAATQAELKAIKVALTNKKLTKDEILELNNRRNEVGKALIQQNADLLTYGTTAEKISKTSAFLASSFWADAYEGATPEQVAALNVWRASLELSVRDMTQTSARGADDTVTAYGDGLTSGAPAVATAAKTLVGGVDAPMTAAANDARHAGLSAAEAYAAGMASAEAQAKVSAAARALAGITSDFLRGKSPTKKGPMSEGGGLGGWGKTAALLFGEGLEKNLPDIGATLGSALGSAPMASYGAMPTAGDTTNIGGNTYQSTLNVQGDVRARNPMDLARTIRRQQRVAGFSPELRQALKA